MQKYVTVHVTAWRNPLCACCSWDNHKKNRFVYRQKIIFFATLLPALLSEICCLLHFLNLNIM